MSNALLTVAASSWRGLAGEAEWVRAVEAGRVLYFPQLAFGLEPGELRLLGPALLARGGRNISLDAAGRVRGAAGGAEVQSALSGLLRRFSANARTLVAGLFPGYEPHLRTALASLRPVEVATREQSVRADDRRLHVDAFRTRPNRGERILRVFSNVDPAGRPRVWHIGPPFEDAAGRYLPAMKPYSALQAKLLHRLRVTRSLRSEYDHLMLQLHDRMKGDDAYQREAPRLEFGFPAGSTWVCFSDQVVHAALSGQYLLEQTFHLPVRQQSEPAASPLAILTRMTGRPLA